MSRNPVYIKHINSKEWRSLRIRKLQADPLCEVCKEKECSTMANEVHHRIPVESAPTESEMKRLMYSYQNLQSLCHSCHSDIHRDMFSHSKEAVKANNQRSTERFLDKYLK